MHVRTFLWLVLFLATSGPALGEDVSYAAFSESYSVAWSGTGLGRATVSLSALPDKDCYRYETVTRPMALVRWLYGSPRETAEFCVVNGQIRPRHYEFVNDKRIKDNYTLDFDWAARKVKRVKGGEITLRDLPNSAYDPLSLRQAARAWLISAPIETEREFILVDDDHIRPYRFALKGREVVKTTQGEFEALRMERIDDPHKSLRLWFAPARGHSIIKVENVSKGEVKLRMEIQ